jgi:putative phosphoribosyl transferase
MRFKNRTQAGIELAQALSKYNNTDGIVYALPRGGVPLGVEVAKALHMPLDLIIPRKIGHPSNPEYAICAVGESGALVCNEAEVSRVDQEWFQQQVQAEREEARRRRTYYLKHRESVPLKGKTAIIVDDGIATGLTMEAAIQDAKQQGPGKVVVAVPVAPRDTMDRLRHEVDEVVTLDIPEVYLGAVGAYYDHFAQVSDEEVVDMLQW